MLQKCKDVKLNFIFITDMFSVIISLHNCSIYNISSVCRTQCKLLIIDLKFANKFVPAITQYIKHNIQKLELTL